MAKKDNRKDKEYQYDDEDEWGRRDSKRYDKNKKAVEDARKNKNRERESYFDQQYSSI
jgi:hypothetical protein